jgi:glycosyltransferase involved in cell wall biosynthesis
MHICHISTFSPTPCGIATYSEALIASIPGVQHAKARLRYHCDRRAPGFFQEVSVEDRRSYSAVAQAINASSVDVVSLQHEFAIFGGTDGEYILDLIYALTKPLVVTLHTTPTLVSSNQQRILRALVQRAALVVVLTDAAKTNLLALLENGTNVLVVRHGVPEVDFTFPAQTALRRRWDRSHVFFSAGHISDRKGYTNALLALCALREVTTDFLYIILGTHQPQFGPSSQCLYSLKRLVGDYRLDDYVRFHENYVDNSELLEHILAADCGLVTYTDCQQSSSGMVPLFLGCGRPVIATPFEYARDAAGRVPGMHLCRGYTPSDLLDVLRSFVSDKETILASMPMIFAATRPWVWAGAGSVYQSAFVRAGNRVS